MSEYRRGLGGYVDIWTFSFSLYVVSRAKITKRRF